MIEADPPHVLLLDRSGLASQAERCSTSRFGTSLQVQRRMACVVLHIYDKPVAQDLRPVQKAVRVSVKKQWILQQTVRSCACPFRAVDVILGLTARCHYCHHYAAHLPGGGLRGHRENTAVCNKRAILACMEWS